MSNTTIDLVQKLDTATYWINQIFPVLQIVFGTFGNVFNIIIFMRRELRNNPCSSYFLAGSINNCFVVDIGLFSRYLASSWNWDPSTTNNALCKIRNLFIYSPLTLALWFVALASIDRFLSSSRSVRLRQMSSLPVARKAIVITTIFIFLSYIHILIYFKTVPSGSGSTCSFSPYGYILFLSFFGPIISCILPIMLMSIFGILMIYNVHNIHGQNNLHGNNRQNKRLRSNDRQLSIMVLFQILITTVISIPYFALAIYNAIAIVMFHYKLSPAGLAIYNFAYNLFRLLYFTNPVLTFYIYTLTGPKFRTEMKHCIQYGLKSVVTTIGLKRYLPRRLQQVLLGENQLVNTINIPLSQNRRRGNAVRPV
ncbi:unnamed protein product [Adineta steineri]|uniref:G-protein coupled receptors family 1 profile domain-containing protein n=1 Tax=Adineta steineri TaxID=433720 RepID=A0A818HEF0_9BILA|nr:unnamed protein product [Adineta steineri]CAF3507148.1 unnamed protein product [Adineta steineri]